MNRFRQTYWIILLCGFHFGAISTARADPPITTLAFAPTGDRLVAGSQKGLVVYAWPELKPIATAATNAPNIHDIAFSPSGNRLAVAGGEPSESGSAEIFSWPDLQSQVTIAGHEDSVIDLCWLDESKILTGSLDHQICLWTLPNGERLKTFRGHSKGVKAIECLPDAMVLVSSGIDQSVRVWELESGELQRSLAIHMKSVGRLMLRPSRKGPTGEPESHQSLPMVLSASEDRTVRLWQPTIGRMVRFARLPSEVRDATWNGDGTLILACCNNGWVYKINPETVEVTAVEEALPAWPYAIAIGPEDRNVAVGGADGSIVRVGFR